MKSSCLEAEILGRTPFSSNSSYPYILLEVTGFYTIISAPPSGHSDYIPDLKERVIKKECDWPDASPPYRRQK